MTSWKIQPTAVKAVLDNVKTKAEALGKELTEEKFNAIGSGLTWGGVLTQDVMVAVGEVMKEQGENLKVIQNHISAGMVGVSNATIAYNHGQHEMAGTFQKEMVKAADTGNFSYFTEHGYK